MISIVVWYPLFISSLAFEYNKEFETKAPLWTVKWDYKKASDQFVSITADRGNDYLYVAGTVFNGNDFDIVLQKYHTNGILIWSKVSGNPLNEVISAISFKQEAIFLIGSVQKSTYSQSLLQKYDDKGNLLWSKLLQANYSFVALDTDVNSIYVTGAEGKLIDKERGTSVTHVLMQKYDMDGNRQWTKTWGDGEGNSIDAYIDSIYITGKTSSDKLFLLKYTKDGELVWEKVLEGEQPSIGSDLTAYRGKLYVTGSTNENWPGSLLLLSFDREGKLIWKKTWSEVWSYIDGIPSKAGAEGNAINAYKGNLYLIGKLNAADDLLLQKYDRNGNLTLTATWDCCGHKFIPNPEDQRGYDNGRDIVVLKNNAYIVGESATEWSGLDLLVQKYDISE